MLPKENGHRTVAILATLYRLLVAVDRDEVDEYDRTTAFEFDSAQPGVVIQTPRRAVLLPPLAK